MREMTIGKNDAGQRLDKFLQKALPSLPPSLMHKYVRLKRIKCNGKRCQTSDRLTEGDVLCLLYTSHGTPDSPPAHKTDSNEIHR